MKTETYFEQSDFELLSKELPADPCTGCPNSYACCGCKDRKAYDEIIELYESANILDLAVRIKLIMSHRRTIKELESQISDTLKGLPKEVLDNVELLKDSQAGDMKLF